jgi:arylsulfatase A-like enzyme
MKNHFTRREILEVVGCGLLPSLAPSKPPRPPFNVLFLMCDQYRPDALNGYGDRNALTPSLDALAASGMSFRQTYCSTPVCVASRNSILTGRFSHSTGVVSNGYRANRSQVSFAQVLRSKAYKTACFGKLHTPGRADLDWDVVIEREGAHKGPVPPGGVVLATGLSTDGKQPIGAPDPFPENETMEWAAKQNTIAFMKENRDRPWLIQCSFKKPHPPFQPPKRCWDMIDRSKLVIPDNPKDNLADANPRYWASIQRRGMDHLTNAQILDGMQGYYGNIACADQLHGEVLKAVDDLGLRDNTLVVFTADHGEMLYDHRLWTKMVFFDPAVRIPLIMRLPGVIPAGRQTHALVHHVDLFPTLMDFAGFETPKSVQGKSMVRLATGKTDRHRDVVRSEFPNDRGTSRREKAAGYDPTMMQFDGRYKLVDNGPDIPPELYDTKTDPRENVNLRKHLDHQERLKRMLAEVRTWVKEDAVPLTKHKGAADDES